MDPDKVKGNIQRPYGPQEPEASDKIDPDKFKKVMKVEESEEAQKRNKRNLPKDEEEGEDENIQQNPTPPPSSSSFSEFMSDKDELGNVFDKESGGIRQRTTPEEGTSFTAPPTGSISTEGVELDQEGQPPQTGQDFSAQPQAQSSQTDDSQAPSQQPPPAAQPPQESSSGGYQQEGETWGQQPQQSYGNTPFYEGELEETPPQISQQQQQQETTPAQGQSSETTPSDQVQQPTPKEKGGEQETPKKKEDDSSLLASQPKTSELEALKKKTPKETTPEEKIIPGGETSKVKEGEQLQEGVAPATKEQKEKTPTMEEGLTGTGETTKGTQLAESKGEDLSGEQESKTPQQQVEEGVVSKPTDTSLKESAKEVSPFQKFTPDEVRSQKMGKDGEAAAGIEGLTVPTSTESGQGEMGQGKKDEDTAFIEANTDTAGIPLPSFDTPVPAMTPSSETPAYSKLSPDMHELFAKIGGVIQVQQDKGFTTTTININMPGSVFNGAQVILEQYSTAPNSYNIQLAGNPESVKVFNQNLDALKDSFRQANFNFETNILNPVLTSARKSPHLIRRKGAAGDKGGRGGKQGG